MPTWKFTLEDDERVVGKSAECITDPVYAVDVIFTAKNVFMQLEADGDQVSVRFTRACFEKFMTDINYLKEVTSPSDVTG
jgi:hypothetical protein